MRTLLIGVVVVAILAATAFFFINSSRKDNSTPSEQNTNDSTTTSSDSNNQGNTDATPASSGVTITYTNNGFTPSSVKVISGGSVTVKNDSSRTIQFESSPHPAHTDNSELNLGQVGAGQSKAFTVTKRGTWGYHDHLNASEEGTIVVE